MYAQLRLNGSWKELYGNIEFSPTVFQKAETLSDEQRQQFNVYQIVDVERVSLLVTQKYGDPIFTIKGDIVERDYPIIDKTSEELEQDRQNRASEVRVERTRLLAESDWTQLTDSRVNKEAWAAYRQELRDITKQSEFPFVIAWPQIPTN